jgi:hypothetical protein
MADITCDFQGSLASFLSRSEIAFPNCHDVPAESSQCICSPLITLDITVKLFLPERRVALRCRGHLATGMAMPKATMYQDDCLEPWQGDIGLARQPLVVHAKPEAQRVERPSERKLGRSIPRSDPRHALGALRGA